MRLTKNFTSEEFLCHCGCDDQDMKFTFVRLLQKMRDIYGKPIHINSGWRCEKYNAQIGGSRRSKHMDGLACDISFKDSFDRYELVKAAFEVGFTGIELGSHHIHLDLRKTKPVCWIDISQ